MSTDDLTLGQIRRELHRLTSLADSAERPRPTRINPADHPMPGHEWEVVERPRHTTRAYRWLIRTAEEDDTGNGLVYVSTPDAVHPGQDFTPLAVEDAQRLGLALLAAADRARHHAAGVTRLEDR